MDLQYTHLANMFGNFSQGSGINKNQLLPAIADLTIAYEVPANVAASGGNPPEYYIVNKLINSAPNFTNRLNATPNPTVVLNTVLRTANPGFLPLYSNDPYIEVSNSSQAVVSTASEEAFGSINGGLSIFAVCKVNLTGSGNPTIRLTDGGSGNEATIYFTTNGTNIVIRGQIGSSNIDYDTGVSQNVDSGARFLGYTTDFTNSELFFSSAGGTGFTSRGTNNTGTNNPGSSYFLEMNAFSVGNARFSLQALYVWRKELNSSEITQLTTYLNDYFLPSL
jgi:hypothetical protein